MQRIKLWQAAAVAAVALGIAITVIWRTYSRMETVPPIPPAFSGAPPAAMQKH
jgi:hypothetical protein